MSPVRATTAAVVAVAAAVLGYLGLSLWIDGGRSFPHPSLLELVALALIGGTALVLGRRVRRMARGLPGTRVTPITAARTFVLAQASVLTGAALAGWHAAAVAVLWSQASQTGEWGGLVRSLVLALAGAALSVVGLVVQAWCRRQDGDRTDDSEAPRAASGEDDAPARR